MYIRTGALDSMLLPGPVAKDGKKLLDEVFSGMHLPLICSATDILGKGRDDVPNIVKETLEEAWNSSAADLVAQQAVAMT